MLDAIIYFLKFHKKTLKKNTYDTYETDFNRFRKFLKRNQLEKLPIRQFDEVKAITFLDELTVIEEISNRSRNNVKGTVGTLFNFFKKRKIISENPFAEISKLPSIAEKHAAFSKEHAKAIINTCIEQKETQLLLFVYFMYYAFTRPGQELRLLKIGDIKEKTIFITAENAKDGTSEHVMIPAPLEKIIQEYKLRDYPKEYYVFSKNNLPGDKHNGEKYMYMRHVEILKKLGIKNLKYDTYSWKHTGVIALFQATQNIELIRQQCRHSDIATTQKYLRDLGLFIDYEQINKFPEL